MNFLVYLLFLSLNAIIPLFPLSFWHFTARVNSYFFYYIIPIRKRTAIENLKLAFPEKNENEIRQIVKGCYLNILTVIVEFFYMRKFSDEDLKKFFNVTNLSLINDKLKMGKGLILISAHYGNWELGAYTLGRMCGEALNVIVKEQANKKVNEGINKIRTFGGNKMIDMRNSLREVLSLLKENKIVAMLGDQSAPKENVRVKFFIENVPTFEGTARFAIKTRTVVLFGVPLRNDDGTYTLTLHEVDISMYTDSTDENVKALTQEHVNLLVDYIKLRPDHWLWFHKRFKNTGTDA